MYSNEDLERFYFQYQTEALPSGESAQSFCRRNNVSYNIFPKWYKDTRQRIVEVSVDGRPSEVRCPDSQVLDAQKNSFGDKRQSARRKPERPDEETDCNNEKDGFDGTASTLSTGSVGGQVCKGGQFGRLW